MPKGIYVRKKKVQQTDSPKPAKTPQQSVPKLLLKVGGGGVCSERKIGKAPFSVDRKIGKAPFSCPGTKKTKVPTDIEEEEDESDSDLEPLSEKLPADFEPGRLKFEIGESDQDTDAKSENKEDSDAGTATKLKRKYKKRRFRLTPDKAKVRKKLKTETNTEGGENAKEKVPEKEATPEPETLSVPMPSRKKLGEYTEFQLFLDNLLRTFQRKDPEQYFALPVTDEIAPNYSSVVSKPMDFYTMRTKLDGNSYASLQELKEDIELICSNATLYNVQNTVYHQAAKKLLTVASHVFSQQNLGFLIKTLPFISTLTLESLGVMLGEEEQSTEKTSSTSQPGAYSCVADDMTAEELLMQARRSASMAADKLAARKPDCRLAFMKQKEDGTTVLNFVTPKRSGERETESRAVRLGDLIPKLKEGTPGLPAYTEPQNNLCVPVSYLDYGPYSSFAPQYDSTWATLNKEDSDLLLKTYGDQAGAQYAWSLKSFASGAGEYVSRMVDNVLDSITDGDHSKAVGQLTQKQADGSQSAPGEGEGIDFTSLKSLENLGLDMSYLSQLEKKYSGGKQRVEGNEQTLLDRNGLLLSDLRSVQYQRLSHQPDFTLTRTEGPSLKETELAGVVLDNFQKIVSQVPPGSLVSETSLRDMMGITSPQDDIDMDVFNEFLVPE